MARFSGISFYHSNSLPPIYESRPLLLPSGPHKSGFQAFLCLSTLVFRFSSLLFFEALYLQQPSLAFKDPVDPTGNRALLFQLVFSLLWLPKRAHPHLRGLFLHPTSIRSTSTSLKQSNLHPLRLLPRPVMPFLAFHIHLNPEFLILEPLIIFLVIRIFFLPLLLHHLYP